MQTRNFNKIPLRILHLEDDSADAELIQRRLIQENLHPEISLVKTGSDFLEALQHRSFDVILADRVLDSFDGFQALELAAREKPDIPFIFVSGALGEDLAVSSLRQGATDYVLKDRLIRLAPAVLRAVREAAERKLRKESDDKLRRSEQELADFFEHAPIGLNWTDAHGRILKVNRMELQLFGYARDEYLGHFLSEFHEDKKALENVFAQLVQGKTVHPYEAQIRCKNGSIKSVVVEINGLWENEKFIHARSFNLDVTARLELEAQLQQSKKLESVGQLASGIAHDFNNLLTVITGHTQLMLAKENLKPSLAEPIREISAAAHRAAELTGQLLTFSRKQSLNLAATDLNLLVENISKMLQHILGKRTPLKLELSASLPAVNVDVRAMEKVLINFAFNSRDALPDGGQVHLATSFVSVDESYVSKNPGIAPGQYVCLTFRDNGCGISPENLPRIFEPFFTTKELDRGTGLGLATAYGIIKQHRGWLRVESELGQGTTFRLFLPEWGNMSQPFLPGCIENLATPGKTEFPSALGGTETILVAENDSPLRELIRHILEPRGYKVIQASNENEALEKWKAFSGKIDLLLTGLFQTKTGDASVVQIIRESKSDVRIIYMGEVPTENLSDNQDLKANIYLQKPFHARKLLEIVYQSLR